MSNRRNRTSRLRARLAALAAAGAVVTTGGVLAAAAPASAAPGSHGASSTVSDTAIAQAARRAGLAGCHGVSTGTWVAIALAESRGNVNAHATGIEDSRGLWQVNLWANSDLVQGRNLYDVSNNAWAAKRVCARQGPTAWSTYTNGAYKAYLGRGFAAARG